MLMLIFEIESISHLLRSSLRIPGELTSVHQHGVPKHDNWLAHIAMRISAKLAVGVDAPPAGPGRREATKVFNLVFFHVQREHQVDYSGGWPFRVQVDEPKLNFHGSNTSIDAGMLTLRELDRRARAPSDEPIRKTAIEFGEEPGCVAGVQRRRPR